MEGLQDTWIKFWVSDLSESERAELSETYLKIEEECENFEVFDSDVWICGFPKTGNTWTSELTWLLINKCDFEKAKINLNDRCSIVEMSLYLQYTADKLKLMLPPHVMGDSVTHARNLPKPRCIRSHLPFHLLPKQIRNGEKHPRIIYVIRNPLDVCVSYFHYVHFTYPKGTLEEFTQLYLDGKILPGDFADHVLSFWKRKHLSNIMFVRYEEMTKDLRGVVQEIASFLNTVVSEQQMDKLLEHLSFESMKNNSALQNDALGFLTPETKLLRVGKVGQYRKEMSAEYIDAFQKWIEEKFGGTGLSF